MQCTPKLHIMPYTLSSILLLSFATDVTKGEKSRDL
jgi:hypothetical protein